MLITLVAWVERQVPATPPSLPRLGGFFCCAAKVYARRGKTTRNHRVPSGRWAAFHLGYDGVDHFTMHIRQTHVATAEAEG